MGSMLAGPFPRSLGALVAVCALAAFPGAIAVTPIPDSEFHAEAKKWCGDANAGDRNMDYGIISEWDTSLVTNMSSTFVVYFVTSPCKDFNEDISKWNTSRVKSMAMMFSQSRFKGDISAWDTSKANDFFGMFWGTEFNGDISAWDTSNATVFNSMFYQSQFNGDISAWDTSKGNYFEGMFQKSQFNGDISAWDTSKAYSFLSMFYQSQFNGDISAWDTSKVRYFRTMFERNTDFNIQYTAFWNTTAAESVLDGQPCPLSLNKIKTKGTVATRCEGYNDAACTPPDDVCGTRATRCIAGYINAQAVAINTDNATEVTCVCPRGSSGDQCNAFTPYTTDALRDAVLDWCDTATSTDPSIKDWNIGRLHSLDGVFRDISSCKNGLNIGGWNVEKIKSMEGTFKNNAVFKEDLSKWKVGSVENFENTFTGATLFSMSYTALWNTSSVTSPDRVLQDQPCPAGFAPTTKAFGSVNERCEESSDSGCSIAGPTILGVMAVVVVAISLA